MINLLPSKYKAELKQEENWRLVLILELLFLIFLISLILVLCSIKTYLQGQVGSLNILINLEEKTFQIAEIQHLREQIVSANENLTKLQSFYRDKKDSIEILEKIFQIIPQGIYLTAFSWQGKISQLSLSGQAPTREALLEFRKNLEGKKEFTEIYFPPSNWLEPSDINFQVTFKLK